MPRRPTSAIDPAPCWASQRVAAKGDVRSLAQADSGIAVGNQHELADVTGSMHQPERVAECRESEDTMGQRSDRARTQCFGNFTEQRARQIGPLDRELIDVDGKIGDVLAQRTQMDAPIEIEIALAEFEKAAERLEYVEALLHRLTAQRVEHDIDASAGTDCAHRIGEAEMTGMVAAAAKLVSSGMRITACAAVVTHVLSDAGASPATRSPTARFVTSSPTARMIPAHSRPKVGPAKPSISASSGSSPIAHIMSRKLSPAA